MKFVFLNKGRCESTLCAMSTPAGNKLSLMHLCSIENKQQLDLYSD